MSRFDQGIPCCDVYPFIYFGKWTKWVYPPLFQTKVRGGKMQTSSPPVITPNRSQSNPDDMITLPRPIQSVGMDLHDVSGTSTGQTLPRERRAPPGTHFCPTLWWVYPHSATIFILHPLLSTFSSTFVRNIPSFDHSSTLKRRPQTSVTAADLVWVCAPPRTIRKWLRLLAFGSCGPDARSLQLLLQTWCGSAPRRGPFANGCCCCFLHINRSGLNHTQ